MLENELSTLTIVFENEVVKREFMHMLGQAQIAWTFDLQWESVDDWLRAESVRIDFA